MNHGTSSLPASRSGRGDRLSALLIKASAGGGGKGMRRVDGRGRFHRRCDRRAARGASAEAFGDDGQCIIEKAYRCEPPAYRDPGVRRYHRQHVFISFERECSIQRRHQKVLEEAPAPGHERTELRSGMGATAAIECAQARSVGYVGAGTVEFLLDVRRGCGATVSISWK